MLWLAVYGFSQTAVILGLLKTLVGHEFTENPETLFLRNKTKRAKKLSKLPPVSLELLSVCENRRSFQFRDVDGNSKRDHFWSFPLRVQF